MVVQVSKTVHNEVCKIPIVLILDLLISTDFSKLRTSFINEPLQAPGPVFGGITTDSEDSLGNERETVPFRKKPRKLVRSADRTGTRIIFIQ
jgi:hypothetical protein